MKKLFLLFLLACGVGLTMTATPAQVSDDNNQSRAEVTTVHKHPGLPARHVIQDGIKREAMIKKIEQMMKTSAPKRMPSSMERGTKPARLKKLYASGRIGNDPVPPPGPRVGTNGGNDLPNLPGKNEIVLDR